QVFPLRKEENALSGVAASRDRALQDLERLVLLPVVLEQPCELRVDLDEVAARLGLEALRGQLVQLEGLRAVAELLVHLGHERVAAARVVRAGVLQQASGLHGQRGSLLRLTDLDEGTRL